MRYRNFRRLIRIITVFIVYQAFTGIGEAGCQPPAYNTPVFSTETPLEITLAFNIKDFLRNRNTEEYQPATISYLLNDSTVERPVRVQPRGNFRRKKCTIPPIRIDFNGKNYGVPLFEHAGKIKLVIPCRTGRKYEQYLIREYLVYKAYQYLSEFSLNTYFLRIGFFDTARNKQIPAEYAFLIEDIDDLADRNNAIEVENTGLNTDNMHRPVMNILGLFQFMTGNTDWNITNLHNIKLIKVKDPGIPRPIPVPYDFDYCGITGANYAIPHESLPIRSVTDRYYMGQCLSREEFIKIRDLFMDNKEKIIRLFTHCDKLDKFSQRSAEKYLEEFYTIIDSEKLVRQWLFQYCN